MARSPKVYYLGTNCSMPLMALSSSVKSGVLMPSKKSWLILIWAPGYLWCWEQAARLAMLATVAVKTKLFIIVSMILDELDICELFTD